MWTATPHLTRARTMQSTPFSRHSPMTHTTARCILTAQRYLRLPPLPWPVHTLAEVLHPTLLEMGRENRIPWTSGSVGRQALLFVPDPVPCPSLRAAPLTSYTGLTRAQQRLPHAPLPLGHPPQPLPRRPRHLQPHQNPQLRHVAPAHTALAIAIPVTLPLLLVALA